MLISIIFAAIMIVLIFGVYKVMGFKKTLSEQTAIAIPLGASLGAMNYFGTKVVVWLLIIFVIATIAIMAAIIVWSIRAANELLEFAFFAGMEIVTFLVLRNLCKALSISSHGTSLLKFLPWAMIIIALGILVSSCISEITTKRSLVAIPIIITIGLLIFGFARAADSAASESKNNGEAGENVTDEDIVAKDNSQSWYAFYNLSLQNDSDQSNDFNFGYSFYKEQLKAEDYDSDLRERIEVDPALGAATMSWVDANIGTDYLGEEYEANDRDWSKAINSAKRSFMADQKGYYAKITAFFKLLDSAEISLTNSDQELNDQMYMNPYTSDEVPEVVVYETTDHIGWQLVYTFNIKDNKIKVAFRIDCGYQPTNVAEIMNITPQKQGGSTSGGGTGGGGTGGGGSDPTPTPTPQKNPKENPYYNNNTGQNSEDGNSGFVDKDVDQSSKKDDVYQPTRPKEEEAIITPSTPNNNNDSSSTTNSGQEVQIDIPTHEDTHDTEEENAGDNNGEFSMP